MIDLIMQLNQRIFDFVVGYTHCTIPKPLNIPGHLGSALIKLDMTSPRLKGLRGKYTIEILKQHLEV